MIIVSDTGPLNYLLQLEIVEVLPRLYDSVLLPEAVRHEMLHPNAPGIVRAWAEHPPGWIVLGHPQALLPLRLGAGELEAISLAVEAHVSNILMDDHQGRQAAQSYDLSVIGTLGVLATAARVDLVDFDEVIGRLKLLGFYVAPALIESLRSPKKQE